ncbi:MAG: ATP-binding cassette domain-containing protein [Flavobacteriales bacterium]|nr:ATP-binding cassette domain-containing protein [Flavobacteriales bacterium]
MGYLPEHNPLYLDLYVKEYLELVSGLHGLKDRSARVKRMIEQVGLGPEQHKLIGALSKGYRQRVGLAQAMIHDPQVLILDEPTSGLDPNQLVEVRALIKTHRRREDDTAEHPHPAGSGSDLRPGDHHRQRPVGGGR